MSEQNPDGQRPHYSVLGVAQAWLPILTAVIGAIWGLWLYLDDQRVAREQASAQIAKDSRAKLIEAQKPFLDRQLGLYFETSQVAGRLVQLAPSNPHWAEDRDRFWELYWSELSMVEHHEVEVAMVSFGTALSEFESHPLDADEKTLLKNAALNLAHALRKGVELSWGSSQSEIVAR